MSSPPDSSGAGAGVTSAGGGGATSAGGGGATGSGAAGTSAGTSVGAAGAAGTYRCDDLAELLLRNGADPNQGNAVCIPLLHAIEERPDLVPLLLEKGADPNTASSGGAPALMLASERANYEVMMLLLDSGADRIEELDDQPRTQAAFMETMGRVFTSLGEFDRAEPLLERAVDIRLRSPDDELALAVEHRIDLFSRQFVVCQGLDLELNIVDVAVAHGVRRLLTARAFP